MVRLAQASEQFFQSRQNFGYRPQYLKSLKQVITRFSNELPGITLDESLKLFQPWIFRQHWGPGTLASNVGRFSSFYGWAVKQGFVSENPCDKIDTPRIHRRTPIVLTPEQSLKAMTWTFNVEPSALGFLTLGLFCGIRPEELERSLDADFDEKHIIVTAEASKIHARRVVPISYNAIRWLHLAIRHGGRLPFCKSCRKRYIRRLRAVLGFGIWPQDLLRHTAASYLLAREQDAPKVALWLGNSPKILMKHYVALVRKEDSDRFWKISPDTT